MKNLLIKLLIFNVICVFLLSSIYMLITDGKANIKIIEDNGCYFKNKSNSYLNNSYIYYQNPFDLERNYNDNIKSNLMLLKIFGILLYIITPCGNILISLDGLYEKRIKHG